MFARLSFSSLASSLTDLSSQVTSTVASTAESLSSSVTHLIEDTQRQFALEQEKTDVLRQQQLSASSRPPPMFLWHIADESKLILEAELKQRILKLALDPRTFLTPPLSSLPFSLEVCWPWAELALQQDAMLSRQRYRLVPRKVNERVFWRHYMARVEALREELAVGLLFETTELEAEIDRTREREERLQRKQEELNREKEERDRKAKATQEPERRTAPTAPTPVAQPATAASPSPERKEERKEERREAAAGREDESDEFISDDYVNVASQDVALVGQMKKELGIHSASSGGSTPAAGAAAAAAGSRGGKSAQAGSPVSDSELDALETMLADIDVNEGEARDDLLDELEGMQDDDGEAPKELP